MMLCSYDCGSTAAWESTALAHTTEIVSTALYTNYVVHADRAPVLEFVSLRKAVPFYIQQQCPRKKGGHSKYRKECEMSKASQRIDQKNWNNRVYKHRLHHGDAATERALAHRKIKKAILRKRFAIPNP